MAPSDPVGAATHLNPYPYYAELRARDPLVFDPGLKMWVAAQAGAVSEVLRSAHCRVRPVLEPVPHAIAGTAAGAVFGQLVRMNDGGGHEAGKRAIEHGLNGVDLGGLEALAVEQAKALGDVHRIDEPARLGDWAFDVPVVCIARLLGWPAESAVQASRWMRDFVACLSPLSTAEQLAAASDAAKELRQRMHGLLAAQARPADLVQAIRQGDWHSPDALVANLIGLLSQTHDATAGLIGNSIVALIQRPELLERLRAAPSLVPAFVREVGRFDPPVQNTRRFVAEPTRVCGVDLPPGATILVVLAAASRDPALHHDAEVLNLERDGAELIGFGAGRHACPGQRIALAIAAGAVAHLVQRTGALNAQAIRWTYRPSANARIPLFITKKELP
ncbi:MAG TPA: cytochrome P450 [Albitalea sp.]|nr:cytochrome P450 [Albitalea sp.]